MADFDASSISSATFNLATLETLLESLSARITTSAWSTLQSMASATYASLKSVSVTVTADEHVLFLALANMSAGTVNEQALLKLIIDGVDMAPTAYFFQRGAGDTAGDDTAVFMFAQTSSLTAGSRTFDLQWKRNAGAGTIYSLSGSLWVIQLKKRT